MLFPISLLYTLYSIFITIIPLERFLYIINYPFHYIKVRSIDPLYRFPAKTSQTGYAMACSIPLRYFPQFSRRNSIFRHIPSATVVYYTI